MTNQVRKNASPKLSLDRETVKTLHVKSGVRAGKVPPVVNCTGGDGGMNTVDNRH